MSLLDPFTFLRTGRLFHILVRRKRKKPKNDNGENPAHCGFTPGSPRQAGCWWGQSCKACAAPAPRDVCRGRRALRRRGTHRRGSPVEAAPLPSALFSLGRAAPRAPCARERGGQAKPLGGRGRGQRDRRKSSGEEEALPGIASPKTTARPRRQRRTGARGSTRGGTRGCPHPPEEVRPGSFQNNKLLMLKQL